MGVSKPILLFSLIWSLEVFGQQEEEPTIEIGIEVISNHRKHSKIVEDDQEFLVLVDTWWKILAWSAAVLVLSCLCCYFSRCCYLCWDCCSDPFWGCCPQSQGCRSCLLMKCCGRRIKARQGQYQICEEIFEETAINVPEPNTHDLSGDEDFTLRTVESLEGDAMLEKLSPIKGRNQSQGQKCATSTPRKRPPKKEIQAETDAIFLELSGESESMPQLYPTHYFNILNLFGIGCSNYKVSTVAEHHRRQMTQQKQKMIPLTNMTTNTVSSSTAKSYQEDSTMGLVSDDDELEEIRSFERSVINNQDFPLSSSFSNMYKKNGLHIEEGRIGRYHPLPEAQFELLPPADFLRKIKRQNSTAGMRRRSRSMETFGIRNQQSQINSHANNSRVNYAKKYTITGSLQQKRFLDEDDSSLPSPPPVPSSSLSKVEKRVTNHNGNVSTSTTTDEEIENLLAANKVGHKRTHSEGSRIGHRRTPSMEGVSQIQNGTRIIVPKNKRSSHQSSDLPPRGPTQQHHKKRYSHRKMKLLDIDNDIEKCILYGKETTL